MAFGKKVLRTPRTQNEAKTRMLSATSPFAVREAYNGIRAKLLFTGRGEKCPVFAVTSAMMHDGKTTNAVNLAISIASTAKRVLLIDGDLRKPTVHRYFGVEDQRGQDPQNRDRKPPRADLRSDPAQPGGALCLPPDGQSAGLREAVF